MFIEMALDRLKQLARETPAWAPLVDGGPRTTALDRQLHEFRMLGQGRLDTVRAVLDANVVVTDAELGYLIGLETARTLLDMMPAAVQAGVTL
jgi:hypothetical protein